MKKWFIILPSIILLAIIVGLVWVTSKQEDIQLADLGTKPDWKQLDPWQKTLTRSEFEYLLNTVYALPGAATPYFQFKEHSVHIKRNNGWFNQPYILHFAQTEPRPIPPNGIYWRKAELLPPAQDRTNAILEGVHLALDPGHIGGRYAQMEERWFQLANGTPVKEGELVLQVAKLLKTNLEAQGARVSLVRDSLEPVTQKRPKDFLPAELKNTAQSPARRLAERLFYRTAEIRARAHKVNHDLQPDLVVALHLNADAWGDPANPQLTDSNHFHILINGAYMSQELKHEDERFAMVQKILTSVYYEEAAMADVMANAFEQITGLPAFRYPKEKPALMVNDNPYIWARNLLANRLYQCPVLYLEPYIMNGRETYQRIQAGDYEGKRLIAGKMRPSLIREYAQAVETGLTEYYRLYRP